jgi:hypothetical protein
MVRLSTDPSVPQIPEADRHRHRDRYGQTRKQSRGLKALRVFETLRR